MRNTVLSLTLVAFSACDNSGEIVNPPPPPPADMAPPPSDLPAPPMTYTVIVQGTMKTADAADSKDAHNMVASGGAAKARMLGDLAHYVYLGVPASGMTKSPAFLAIDRWNSLSSLMNFYGDPQIQAAFGSIFSGPPTITVTSEPANWSEYGVLNPTGQTVPLYLYLVQAKFLATDLEQSRTAHNNVFTGAKTKAMMAGDIAHLVFLSPQDPTRFTAIDLWNNTAGADGLYGDPNVQQAFGTVFSGAPTISAYQHAGYDWYQWLE